jgi:nicotinate-nucleotide adenylyltransferase
MKKIGLLGGSFDPIHFGHLNLAFELMERGQLEEVWFIPAHVNPLKTHIPPVSFEHRLAMLKLAVEGISPFKIKDLESRRPAPSYTVETLRLLLAEFTARVESPHFYLLLGEDSIASFVHWHLPHEIVKMAHLLIGSRSGSYVLQEVERDPVLWEAIQKGMIKTRLMDISSTDLRHRLNQGLYCGHLVPVKVLDYIHKNQLYQSI